MSKNYADLLDYFATTADWRCSFAGFSNAENSTADNTKARGLCVFVPLC